MPIFASYTKPVQASTRQTRPKHSCSFKAMLTSFSSSFLFPWYNFNRYLKDYRRLPPVHCQALFTQDLSLPAFQLWKRTQNTYSSREGGRDGHSNPANGRTKFIPPLYHQEPLPTGSRVPKFLQKLVLLWGIVCNTNDKLKSQEKSRLRYWTNIFYRRMHS